MIPSSLAMVKERLLRGSKFSDTMALFRDARQALLLALTVAVMVGFRPVALKPAK